MTLLGILVNFSDQSEIDQTYLLVKKMQRTYKKIDSGVYSYYEGDFNKIEKAYINGRKKDFREAVEGLLCAIQLK